MHELNLSLEVLRNNYLKSSNGAYKRAMAYLIDHANKAFGKNEGYVQVTEPFAHNEWSEIYSSRDKAGALKLLDDLTAAIGKIPDDSLQTSFKAVVAQLKTTL